MERCPSGLRCGSRKSVRGNTLRGFESHPLRFLTVIYAKKGFIFTMVLTPLFSIIIPVYNVEPYLSECLDSIASQTLTNFEVICVNDGSTDNSLSILEEYAKRDNRFKVFTQENQGVGVARNFALEAAQGKYIMFVDPDDWIVENALEEIYNYFIKTDAEVIEFDYKKYFEYSGNWHYLNHAKSLKKDYGVDLYKKAYYNWRDLKRGALLREELHAWTRAYTKEFLDRVEAKFAPVRLGEDHLFCIIVLLNAGKIFYLDKYLYNYRCREGSIVNSNSCKLNDYFEYFEFVKEYLIKIDLYEQLKDAFKNHLNVCLAWHYKIISSDMKKAYLLKCQEYLTRNEYKKMLSEIKRSNRSLFEYLFSVKNDYSFAIKRKIITILGFKIKIKMKPKSKTAEGN